ncbi:hypothetical protein HELRODRAFT_62273 [Helobdella robusta]|uniref:Myotubularin phosphatase domain-containing protein n=1 Tax=Helobdella robusta TaxID=6412 RepID=T1FWY3_HELRO|nr:hypothetical protein HELRODRAFT_62273 [Helobdella robusta]ESO12515.1 hypothetical protein HELRODRAFT_62273 [Helobdella robusta]
MSDHDHSMEEITFKDFYPLKQTTYEKDNLMIPFHPIAGEYIDYIGTMANGIIAISNYRFFVHRKELPFINLPLGLIDTVECQNLFTLVLLCKDAKTYRYCSFATNDKCMEWQKRLLDSLKQSSKLSSSFALTFAAWCSSEKSCSESLSDEWFQGSVFDREVTRMAFNLNYERRPWRICHANENYEICETYPRLHIVPSSISDDMVRDMAKYRSNSRFPSVVWRFYIQTGLVMVRCSQPNVGLLWWRNSSDEAFIRSVGESCQLNPGLEQIPIVPDDAIVVDGWLVGRVLFFFLLVVLPHKDLLLIDARSYAAATANRAKGGGVECNEYYPNANVVFMNLPNIHSIKRCFINLRNICTNSDDASWLSSLESSKWLFHISNLLKSSLVVVDSIRVEHKSVLVHCSDGWDRTPQILSLAQIMLDPYYRTMQGFHDLVEREWLGFGHRFADRCGQGTCYYDNQNDRCPIFLQWVDCLHQLVKQFPCSFEFNMNFLIKLVDHTYSCLFGDFLYNTDKDRSTLSSQYRTTSVWTFLLDNKKLLNPLFRPSKKVGSYIVYVTSCKLQLTSLRQF